MSQNILIPAIMKRECHKPLPPIVARDSSVLIGLKASSAIFEVDVMQSQLP